MEDTCANCGKELVDEYDAWGRTNEARVLFGDITIEIRSCCEHPKKATKNDIVIKILNDL